MPVVDPEFNQTQQQPAQEPKPEPVVVVVEKPEVVAKMPEPETVAKPAPVV
jgi:hypothetical protein